MRSIEKLEDALNNLQDVSNSMFTIIMQKHDTITDDALSEFKTAYNAMVPLIFKLIELKPIVDGIDQVNGY